MKMNNQLIVGEEYQRVTALPALKQLSFPDFKEIISLVSGELAERITSASTLIFEDRQTKEYQSILAKLEKSYPLEYITGRTQFYGYNLTITPNVLIPRPETEQLVDLAKSIVSALPDNINILEIGSGSGCITTALSLELEKSNVNFKYTAIDISPGAIDNTTTNLMRYGMADKISTLPVSLRSFIDNYNSKRFNLIVSNPPYLTDTQMDDLAPSVKYEPEVALFGGADGVRYFREILEMASRVQEKSEKLPALVLEADPLIMSDLRDLIAELYSQDLIKVVIDLFGQERFITAQSL